MQLFDGGINLLSRPKDRCALDNIDFKCSEKDSLDVNKTPTSLRSVVDLIVQLFKV